MILGGALLFICVTFALPWSLFLAVGSPSTGGTLVATIVAILTALSGALVVRQARAPRAAGSEQSAKGMLGALLAGALILTTVGSILIHQTRRPPAGFPESFGGGGPEVLRYIGTAFLTVAVLGVLLGLTLIPSTARELKRQIDVEASSVALGTCLFFFWMYGAFEKAFTLPRFSRGVATVSILVAYLLARLLLKIRYR
jgi:cytochrome c biogenesis factor